MALPYVKINFGNGTIGGTPPMDDGVTLMILDDIDNDLDVLNIDDYKENLGTGDTALLEVEAFYNQVNGNCRLIITDYDSICETVSESTTLSETKLKAKLEEYNGAIRTIVINNVADSQTITKLQNVAEYCTNTLFAPVLILVGVDETLATSQSDFKTLSKNRIACVDSVEDKAGTSLLYYVAGRIGVSPVQRSIARVRDGAIYATVLKSADGKLVTNTYAEGRNTKGLITARNYVGKSGYYFSDDIMATATSDDYSLIPRRRTIDKAYRIAYQTFVNYIGEEIPVNADGTIAPAKCKEIENTIEQQIYSLMTLEGNLGVEQGTGVKGVTCYINPEQNVVSTSTLDLTLNIRPYGYAKYIEVNLGFSINA